MLVWQQNDSCLGTDGAQTLVSKSIMSLIDKICQGKLLLLLFFEEKKKSFENHCIGFTSQNFGSRGTAAVASVRSPAAAPCQSQLQPDPEGTRCWPEPRQTLVGLLGEQI